MIQNPGLPFPYSMKRHGVTVLNCDDEPVRTPGCIQSHGMLLVMDPQQLIVTQVSENCGQWTGLGADAVLGTPLAQVIGDAATQAVRQMIDGEMLVNNPTYVLTTRLPDMAPVAEPLDLSVHLSDGVLILELEPTGRNVANTPDGRDYYLMVKQTLNRLRTSGSLSAFCNVVAQEVRRVTGLDRIMVYRFHADDSGEVVAEARRADLHSWLGLRYPASDIPKPAREIFKRIGVRPVPDAKAELCELVPLVNPISGRALDMTYCALRGASVMYTQYLANMGVAATLTMPILREGHLWGLVVCHQYTPIVMPYHLRAAAEFVGQIASLEIANAEAREHLQYRQKIEAVHENLLTQAALGGELSVIADDAPSLLGGIDAGGVAVLRRNRWSTAGRTPSEAQLHRLAGWLREQISAVGNTTQTYASDALDRAFAPAAEFREVASGVLAVAASGVHGDLILWLRPEQVQTFTWGGNPYDKPSTVGSHGARLTPRHSFDLWQEEVRGRSVPWKPVEIDAAMQLRQRLGDLIVSRAAQLDEINAELIRSNEELDAFAYVAGHDLKEPLRGIYKNGYHLMEELQAGEPLDQPARERLDTLLRLTVRMDNLLDALLHFARVGRLSLEYESVDLGAVVTEALEMMGARLAESGIEVRMPRPLPWLSCDRVRVREVFANLISNAVKYNDKPQPWMEIGYLDAQDAAATLPGYPVAGGVLSGTVFFVRDNGIGIDAKHRERVFQIFKRLHPRDAFGGGSGAGLAIARKLVEQHNGRIWFDSVLGTGTTFYFTLGSLPAEQARQDAH